MTNGTRMATRMATIAVDTSPCPMCGEQSVVCMRADDYLRWFHEGTFPMGMSLSVRELLITGTHPICWDEMFADNEAF